MEKRKIIKDFPKYEVSDLGNIYKLKTGYLMKQFYINKQMYVTLHNDECKKSFQVARLVADSFIKHSSEEYSIKHKDNDIHNNKASNLDLVKRNNTILKRLSSISKNKDTVLELRKGDKLIGAYDNVTELGRKIGIKQSNVYRLIDLKPKDKKSFFIKRVKKE